MASTGLAAVPEAAKLVFHTAVKRNGNTLTGVVVSAGLAAKTAKVRVGGEEWNKKVRKFFKKPEKHLVHDPNSSLRTGDVVEIISGWRTSKHKRHIVTRIIAPFGPPIDERPPVPTAAERELEHALFRKAKKERKVLTYQTERLTTKVNQAAKVTEEISRMAATLDLLKDVDVQWTATPVKVKGPTVATPVVGEPKRKQATKAKRGEAKQAKQAKLAAKKAD